jgi:hypothetical protein
VSCSEKQAPHFDLKAKATHLPEQGILLQSLFKARHAHDTNIIKVCAGDALSRISGLHVARVVTTDAHIPLTAISSSSFACSLVAAKPMALAPLTAPMEKLTL